MIENTLLPDLPRPPRRYEVTVTVPRADDPDPALPPGGHAALNLVVAALSADGLLAAWTSSQTVVSMIVEAECRAGAMAAGTAVAQALGGANGTATVAAGPIPPINAHNPAQIAFRNPMDALRQCRAGGSVAPHEPDATCTAT